MKEGSCEKILWPPKICVGKDLPKNQITKVTFKTSNCI